MIRFSGRSILLDIEGTTSSISFVHDVLFPYASQHLSDFLHRHWHDPDVRKACEQIARDAGAASLTEWHGDGGEDLARKQVMAEVQRLMAGDVKATGLKELQGLIWRDGFLSGHLRAHVYPDVPVALQDWKLAGLELRIYSSGSVTAQKLFFGHTESGDLLPYFSGHYDTTIGGKKEAESYRRITSDMGIPPNEILFCSDVPEELDAAKEAGLNIALSLRPGNKAVAKPGAYPNFKSFGEIQIDR